MQVLPISTTTVTASVVDSETALVEALQRLNRLRCDALAGGRYDPDEYDGAVIAYRHARAAAEDARLSWERQRAHAAYLLA